jgi:hypothetical protein
MPWWSWILIWAGLSLLLMLMLAAFALLLFRKVIALFAALEALAALAGLLRDRGEGITDQHERLSILDLAAIRRRRDQVREQALTRRQWRHDRRIARAKALIAVDASQQEWFTRADEG